jgi:hypothetical protein
MAAGPRVFRGRQPPTTERGSFPVRLDLELEQALSAWAGSTTPAPARSSATPSARGCVAPESVTTFFTGSSAPPARRAGPALRAARARRPRTPARRRRGTDRRRRSSRPGTSAFEHTAMTRHGPQLHAPPSRRPDSEGCARRRPASRAQGVASRWPPATLDPDHRRASGLAVGSVALPCPVTNAGTNDRSEGRINSGQPMPRSGVNRSDRPSPKTPTTTPRVPGSIPGGPTHGFWSRDVSASAGGRAGGGRYAAARSGTPPARR